MFFDGFNQARGTGSGPTYRNGWSLTNFGYAGGWVTAAGDAAYPLKSATNAHAMEGDYLLERTHPWAGARFALGVACRMTAWSPSLAPGRVQSSGRGNILALTAGGERRVLWWSWQTGHVHFGAVPGNALPRYGAPYFYEVVLDRLTKTATVFINGKEDLVTPISDAMAAANEVTIGLGWMAPGSYQLAPVETAEYRDIFYACLYLNDGEPLGPIDVSTRFPSNYVADDWQDGGWWLKGRLISPDATAGLKSDRFVIGKTPGSKAPYTSSVALNKKTNPVVGTKVGVFARKTRNTEAQLGMFVGGTDIEQRDGTQPVGSTWERCEATFEPRPGDTPDKIVTAPFGLTIEPL
jgi:hypothetical protein